MSKIITIFNMKGGVGKTTVTINLGASLAVAEKKVLLLDFDPSGAIGLGLGLDNKKDSPGIYEFILGIGDISDTIYHLKLLSLDIIPNNLDVIYKETRLLDFLQSRNILKTKLNILLKEDPFKYDYILIDTPPLLTDYIFHVLKITDSVLIPLKCDYFSLAFTEKILGVIQKFKSGMNPQLTIEGFLLNFFEKITKESRYAVDTAKTKYNELLLKTYIPKTTSIGYSLIQHKPMVVYDAISPASVAFLSLANEILSNNHYF